MQGWVPGHGSQSPPSPHVPYIDAAECGRHRLPGALETSTPDDIDDFFDVRRPRMPRFIRRDGLSWGEGGHQMIQTWWSILTTPVPHRFRTS